MEFEGDSSEIVVDEALQFIGKQVAADKPSFSVIWYGTPHSPFSRRTKICSHLPILTPTRKITTASWWRWTAASAHCVKTCAICRLPKTRSSGSAVTMADCRISRRKPWAACEVSRAVCTRAACVCRRLSSGRRPSKPRVSNYPAVTMDIFPTIADIVGLRDAVMLQPQDGVSLRKLFTEEIARRDKPIPFCCLGNTALLDNNVKLIRLGNKPPEQQYELYDLASDPREENNLYFQQAGGGPADADGPGNLGRVDECQRGRQGLCGGPAAAGRSRAAVLEGHGRVSSVF